VIGLFLDPSSFPPPSGSWNPRFFPLFSEGASLLFFLCEWFSSNREVHTSVHGSPTFNLFFSRIIAPAAVRVCWNASFSMKYIVPVVSRFFARCRCSTSQRELRLLRDDPFLCSRLFPLRFMLRRAFFLLYSKYGRIQVSFLWFCFVVASVLNFQKREILSRIYFVHFPSSFSYGVDESAGPWVVLFFLLKERDRRTLWTLGFSFLSFLSTSREKVRSLQELHLLNVFPPGPSTTTLETSSPFPP